MLPNLVFVKSGALFVWFVVLSLWERLSPAVARPPANARRRIFNNGGLWLCTLVLSALITTPLSIGASALALWARPDWLHPAAALGIDILVLDAWIYAWHRANHEWPLLWRFHAIHHRDEFLDTTSAVRFHPGEVLLSSLARAPIIIALAMPSSSVIVFETLVLASALFHHADMRLPPRLEASLRTFIVTPSHHWVHHHASRRDTDANYATLLTLWDKLFGSWSPHARTPDMPIGIENGPKDARLPELLSAPLKPQRQ